tara:strand:+ start:615 stop:737 length:123 start_codon:yes stop_codon:yes gene_type:complete
VYKREFNFGGVLLTVALKQELIIIEQAAISPFASFIIKIV